MYFDPSDKPNPGPYSSMPYWHPYQNMDRTFRLPEPRIVLSGKCERGPEPHKQGYNLHGFIEIDDVYVIGLVNLPDTAGQIMANLFFDRFELEVKVTLSTTPPQHHTYDSTNQFSNPDIPYEFRDANGTKYGPYPFDSRIDFMDFEALPPHRGIPGVIRYYFKSHIPKEIFAKYPGFHRHVELEARAWYSAETFPKLLYNRPVLAMSMSRDTCRAYIAPDLTFHVCDPSDNCKAAFAAHAFRKLPRQCPLPNVPPMALHNDNRSRFL